MAGTWHDEGEVSVGNTFLKGTTAPTLFVGLYSNASALTDANTMADVTEIQTPGNNGYNRQQFQTTSWTESNGTFTHAQVTFTSTASWGTVTGYFITTTATDATGDLIASESFASSIDVNQANFDVKLTANIAIE